MYLDIETIVVRAEARSVRFRSCASRNSLVKTGPQGRGACMMMIACIITLGEIM